MSDEFNTTRRSVLKKAVTTTAVGGVAAGGFSGMAAASQSTLTVKGGSSTTWSYYHVVVDDPSGTGGNDVDSRDSVTQNYDWGSGCNNEHTLFEGYIKDGGTDTYYFDGSIQEIRVSWDHYNDSYGGDVSFQVDGGTGRSLDGFITMYHNGEGGDYEFCTTGTVTPSSGIEDGDTTTESCADGSGCCAGNDYYEATGEITYAQINTSGDGYVDLRHTYDSQPC